MIFMDRQALFASYNFNNSKLINEIYKTPTHCISYRDMSGSRAGISALPALPLHSWIIAKGNAKKASPAHPVKNSPLVLRHQETAR